MQAIQGSTHVIHVASPFVISEPRDEMELIRPAVEGTKAVLKACKASGVIRLSITSSLVAIYECQDENQPDKFDETHWTDLNKPGLGAYEKSKTLAEKAAWEFLEALPESERFELTTVNPGFIAGPTLVNTNFASSEVIGLFMNDKLPGGCPLIAMAIVDVREVAQAHVNCIKRDEAQGKRFLLTAQTLWMTELGGILSNHFTPLGYTIPSTEAKFCLVRFAGFFSAQAAKIASLWGKEAHCDNSRSKEVLGIEYRSMDETLHEMGLSMIEHGIIEDKRPK